VSKYEHKKEPNSLLGMELGGRSTSPRGEDKGCGMANQDGEVNEYKLAVGERIADARDRKGVTQKELATLIHKNVRTVSLYETGHILPPGDVLNEIAAILEVGPSWLREGDAASANSAEMRLLMKQLLEASSRLTAINSRIYDELRLMRADFAEKMSGESDIPM
jgi:transcriptional regulator with XRE-family HTH domain